MYMAKCATHVLMYCVVYLDVLPTFHMCNTNVYPTHVLHIYVYTCIECVGYTHVLHLFVYTCNICVSYTPVLHIWSIQVIYTFNTGVYEIHV